MAKPKKRYVCQACGSVSSRWQGQCADCDEWNSLVEDAGAVVTPFSARHNLRSGGQAIGLVGLDADVPLPGRMSTGIAEFDRALGGGLIPGSATLIGGDPGIGKSTLLLQAAARIAGAGGSVVYVSGEEATDQIRLRAQRLGVGSMPVGLAAATSVRDILTTLGEGRAPDLLVVDSIQTMHSDLIEGAPGTVSQVRASAHELIRFAKESETALVLVGHVTKDGSIAGPRVLEHMVDTVLSFEGERSHQYRLLRATKNRFGGTDEIGVFGMSEGGLEEIANPSTLFLTHRGEAVSGAVVFPAMEGTRPVLVEIQALTVRLASGATPRRAVVGWDSGRLAMILAVLEARCGLSFSSAEVYLNVAGGYRISDPAGDLAVAAALVSALSERPLAIDGIAFGEVALSGELRPVAHGALRLKEAAKLGFAHAFVPASLAAGKADLQVAGSPPAPCLGRMMRVPTNTPIQTFPHQGGRLLEIPRPLRITDPHRITRPMGLTALDVVVLLFVGGGLVLGYWRGFVAEVMSLLAWVVAIFGLKLLHAPFTELLDGMVGTWGGAAVLSFALIFLIAFAATKLVAARLTKATRASIINPFDRVLGTGFGALKGLIGVTILYLLASLVYDVGYGRAAERPDWMVKSRTYPLLNASGRAIVDFVEARSKADADGLDNAQADRKPGNAQ